jgi:hypothetical protein
MLAAYEMMEAMRYVSSLEALEIGFVQVCYIYASTGIAYSHCQTKIQHMQ